MAAKATHANEFRFENFYDALQLSEIFEDLLARGASCQSYMKTLTEAYKVYVRTHKNYLETKLQNSLPTCQESWQKFHKEILEDVGEISKELDVIVICDKKKQFDEKVERWRANACVEQSIHKDIVLVKKKNLEMLRRIRPHTQEFCLRLMSAAGEMKGSCQHSQKCFLLESQREFPKTVEDKIREAKADLQRLAIKMFQQNRLGKLKQVCGKIRKEEDAAHKERMIQYNRVRERMRLSQDRLYIKQKEKNKLSTELASLPRSHENKLEELSVKTRKLMIKLHKLEERNQELVERRKTAEQTLADKKNVLLIERARFQAVLAKERALLCQVVKHCKIHGHGMIIPGANICAD